MDEHDWLAAQFEAERPHLRAVAYRMLGSLPEAEDAVQEGWLHFSRSDQTGIENLRGWLTTVVARICLDMLRSRRPGEKSRWTCACPRCRVWTQARSCPTQSTTCPQYSSAGTLTSPPAYAR